MSDEFWQRASEAQEAAYSLHHLLYVLNCETEPFSPGPEDEARICALIGNLVVRDERLRRAMDALYQTVKGEESADE